MEPNTPRLDALSQMEPDTHRLEALSQAVRVALAIGGEPTEDTVKRAEAFNSFLTGE